MFDTVNHLGIKQSVIFNAVAGTLIKSHEKSRIIRFHMTSPMAKLIFDEVGPHLNMHGKRIDIVVLQVMLCGDKELLVEYAKEKDLEPEEVKT